MVCDRAFVFHGIPCGKTFPLVPRSDHLSRSNISQDCSFMCISVFQTYLVENENSAKSSLICIPIIISVPSCNLTTVSFRIDRSRDMDRGGARDTGRFVERVNQGGSLGDGRRGMDRFERRAEPGGRGGARFEDRRDRNIGHKDDRDQRYDR